MRTLRETFPFSSGKFSKNGVRKMAEDKLKGFPSFQEVHDYLIRTGQVPNDDFDIDYIKESEVFKALMPKLNLKEKTIIMTSIPNSKKGFFWEMMNKSDAKHSMENED